MTKEGFKNMMALITACFPGREVPKETHQAYFRMLEDLPDEVGLAAAHHVLSHSEFFPTVAAIRQAAGNIGTYSLPSPEEAWDEVNHQLRYLGNFEVPQFSHPLIKRAVDAMGWRELRSSENISIDRAQFIKIYGSHRNRMDDDLVTPNRVKELGSRMSGNLLVVKQGNSGVTSLGQIYLKLSDKEGA